MSDDKPITLPVGRPRSRRLRTQQVVKVDLGKLKLPGPGAAAGWESDLPPMRPIDREQAVQDLRTAGLSDDVIATLEGRLRTEVAVHRIGDSWPTVGEDRKVLDTAADLAYALATILDSASPRADAEIDTAMLKSPGDFTRRDLCRELSALAHALDARVEKMPPQTRNKPRVGIVWALDEVAGHLLPAPTTRPDSRYYKACSAAFALAGYPVAPDKAIKRYLDIKAENEARGL